MRASEFVSEHIVKVPGGYELRSRHGNKNLGKYPTRAGAEKRERQVQYFKHAGKSVEEEQLDELSFLGSECTKDCSGHRAGYNWSHSKGLKQGNSPYSPSFNKGAALAVQGL